MRKKTATALLVMSLLTGGGAALVTPGLAFAADSSTGTSVTDRAATRLSAIKTALTGLVDDKTITQAQANKVASTLAEAELGWGHGGRGGGRVSPEATAKVLGITVDQLRTSQEAGQTLTQIATAYGVSKADLIKGLVAAAKAQLAADVKAGQLTQAHADEKSATLLDRITERVDQAGHGGRHHGGRHHGDRHHGDDQAAEGNTPDTATPSPSSAS